MRKRGEEVNNVGWCVVCGKKAYSEKKSLCDLHYMEALKIKLSGDGEK